MDKSPNNNQETSGSRARLKLRRGARRILSFYSQFQNLERKKYLRLQVEDLLSYRIGNHTPRSATPSPPQRPSLDGYSPPAPPTISPPREMSHQEEHGRATTNESFLRRSHQHTTDAYHMYHNDPNAHYGLPHPIECSHYHLHHQNGSWERTKWYDGPRSQYTHWYHHRHYHDQYPFSWQEHHPPMVSPQSSDRSYYQYYYPAPTPEDPGTRHPNVVESRAEESKSPPPAPISDQAPPITPEVTSEKQKANGSSLPSSLRSLDIVCGRGAPKNFHYGNQAFRELVEDYQTSYLCAKRNDKPQIALKLLDILKSRGARFVRRHKSCSYRKTASSWVEINDKAAYEKVCQALRDGAPHVRRQMESKLKPTKKGKENEPTRS